jgi:hypothetical protein
MPETHIPVMNGNGKLSYWLLGLLGTVFTTGSVAWLTNINTLTRSQGERIAVLESQMVDQRNQLERMDHKLDRILEQKGK